MKLSLRQWLPPTVSAAVIAVALVVLARKLANVDPALVATGFSAIPAAALWLAGLFAAGAWLALATYEVFMLRYLRRGTGWPLPLLTGFIAYPVGHAIGFGALSGGAVRYRIYSAAGWSGADIGKVILLSVMPYGLGLGLLCAIAMLAFPEDTSEALGVELRLTVWIGAALAATHLIYVALVVQRVKPLASLLPSFELPTTRLTSVQYGLGIVEVLCSVAVLYLLLPEEAGIGFPAFVAVYIAAVAAGALSGVPAGLGVFESVLLVTLTGVPAEELLGAVLAYRLVYELVPFAFSLLLMLVWEVRGRR